MLKTTIKIPLGKRVIFIGFIAVKNASSGSVPGHLYVVKVLADEINSQKY